MNTDSWSGRSIVYKPAFSRFVQQLGIDYERLDEAMRGLEWALSNRPEAFPQVYDSELRMARIGRFPGVPGLRIWFTFDDTTVTVLSGDLIYDDDS